MANLTGNWLGTYWQHNAPNRFEMAIAQGGNALSGNILDDSYLGEAILTGEAIGRNIQFTKKYISGLRESILYQGVLSENEELIQGEWSMQLYSPEYGALNDSGRWEARRSDNDLLKELTDRLTKQKELQPSIY
jgi:hypothetical protein